MKKKIMMSMPLLSLMLLACGGSDDENVISDNNKEPGWELVWQDEFDGETVDESVWSRITEGTPDWKNIRAPTTVAMRSAEARLCSMEL